MMKLPVAPVPVLYKGKPAVRLTGWQASQNGDPKRHTAVVRVNGRKVVAFAKDVKSC